MGKHCTTVRRQAFQNVKKSRGDAELKGRCGVYRFESRVNWTRLNFDPARNHKLAYVVVFLSLHQVRLSEVLSRRINQNPSEAAAASNAEKVLRQTQLTNPEEGLALAPSGWHPVRASFEVDKVN